MVAAVPAASKGDADRQGRALDRARRAGRLRLAGDRRRAHLPARQRRRAVRVRREDRQAAVAARTSARSPKASPVLADGKLYIGTENTGDAGGKFFIIRPHADKAEILDQDWLGTPQKSELIIASPIVARGRVYVTSMDALYAIGPKAAPAAAAAPAPAAAGAAGGRRRRPPSLLVTPTELILKPGEAVALTVRAVRRERQRRSPAPAQRDVDARGPEGHGRRRQVHAPTPRPERRPAWSRRRSGRCQRRRAHPRHPRPAVDLRLRGRPRDAAAALGQRHRQVRGARCRRQQGAGQARGEPVRVRQAHAGRSSGRPELSNYTIEADVRAMERRRQMGDVGIVAQRYELVLFGNHQRLELQPWQPETQRTVQRSTSRGRRTRGTR